MDALEGVREDEVLVLHCELNGDCQEPDGRHSERSRVSEVFQAAESCQLERSRVSSELLQSAGDCQSEHPRVLFECFMLARQKMRVKYSRPRMMASIYQSSTPGHHCSESSASWLPRSRLLWPSASRVIFHGNS